MKEWKPAPKQATTAPRELIVKILTDEEHHIDWLEAQLNSIKEIGIENYLTQQLGEPEAH